jgi:Peptidase family S58
VAHSKRLGSYAASSSDDLVVSFSTTEAVNTLNADETVSTPQVPNDSMNAIFQATVEATEAAIINAMIAAKSMTGADGWRFYALPHDELRTIKSPGTVISFLGHILGVPSGDRVGQHLVEAAVGRQYRDAFPELRSKRAARRLLGEGDEHLG